ncbi:MAG: DUF600 domain-containing protein [Flavobacteriaceae bacterium]|nr:DUF600 domain-containing protein [Flavobacteriaceae bacterium]
MSLDKKFQELFTKMVEISFEYVNRNVKEVDSIYIYNAMEDGEYYYNVFYKINNSLVKSHEVNQVSVDQYDISDDRSFGMLCLGGDTLEEIEELFTEHNREIPTLMKMYYNPKSGEFDNNISYELNYSNHKERTADDGFEDWFKEEKNKLAEV